MRINFTFIEERYNSLKSSLGTIKEQAKQSVSDIISACSSISIIQSAKVNYEIVADWLKSKKISTNFTSSEQVLSPVYEMAVIGNSNNLSQAQVDNTNPNIRRQLPQAGPSRMTDHSSEQRRTRRDRFSNDPPRTDDIRLPQIPTGSMTHAEKMDRAEQMYYQVIQRNLTLERG